MVWMFGSDYVPSDSDDDEEGRMYDHGARDEAVSDDDDIDMVKEFAALRRGMRAYSFAGFTFRISAIESLAFLIAMRSTYPAASAGLLLNSTFSGAHVRSLRDLRHISSDLTDGARMSMSEANAGGDSVASEALSIEVVARAFGAELVCTEMGVEYFPAGGSMTDYVVAMQTARRRVVASVSVTRAMEVPGMPEFGIAEAAKLLMKKLSGVKAAARNMVVPRRVDVAVLHVWASSGQVARKVRKAYRKVVPEEVKQGVVVLLTVAKCPAIFSRSRGKL
ncbi:hypothetical protein BJ742DRAFT_826625 [Cladochytrium replicatum]|nr:hypothetical protein BJ742DRAFT_826625 [Cladochytrium replicatum]